MLLCVVLFCAVKINSPANHLNADDKADSGHSKTRIQLLLSAHYSHCYSFIWGGNVCRFNFPVQNSPKVYELFQMQFHNILPKSMWNMTVNAPEIKEI
jgi:hypothetical protein